MYNENKMVLYLNFVCKLRFYPSLLFREVNNTLKWVLGIGYRKVQDFKS